MSQFFDGQRLQQLYMTVTPGAAAPEPVRLETFLSIDCTLRSQTAIFASMRSPIPMFLADLCCPRLAPNSFCGYRTTFSLQTAISIERWSMLRRCLKFADFSEPYAGVASSSGNSVLVVEPLLSRKHAGGLQ